MNRTNAKITNAHRIEAQRRLLPCMVLWIVSAGCSGPPSHPELVKVTGTVHVDGQPVEGVVLTLHPDSAGSPAFAAGAVSTGVSGADGRFEISTFSLGDGALPGAYNITCVWSEFDPISRSMKGDKLAGGYASPQNTLVTWDIAKGDTYDVGIVDLVKQKL
jgi:hypothetical protein